MYFSTQVYISAIFFFKKKKDKKNYVVYTLKFSFISKNKNFFFAALSCVLNTGENVC